MTNTKQFIGYLSPTTRPAYSKFWLVFSLATLAHMIICGGIMLLIVSTRDYRFPITWRLFPKPIDRAVIWMWASGYGWTPLFAAHFVLFTAAWFAALKRTPRVLIICSLCVSISNLLLALASALIIRTWGTFTLHESPFARIALNFEDGFHLVVALVQILILAIPEIVLLFSLLLGWKKTRMHSRQDSYA